MTSEKIGRYQILNKIGEGSMATVYLALDTFIKRLVAVKVISPDLIDSTFEDRFRFEAELIGMLDHPFIVPIYDFGTEGNQMYIVMRYMSNGTLKDKLKLSPYSLPEFIDTLERLVDVLELIHAQGIIHRDLKPGNILYNNRDEAFLGDFGIAKNIIQPGGFTATDMILGTIDYMSPEQIQGGQPLDGRTDIYSLGIILYFVLTGTLPFQRDTLVGTAMAHISDPIPSLEPQLPHIFSAWDAIFAKALAKDPADRYQTASELLHEIKTLVRQLYPNSL